MFNFGLRTNIDLPGEARTDTLIYYAEENAPSENLVMRSTDLATNSFGQNYNVTMIQVISAFSSCVNGGYYYKPHVVKKIMDSGSGTMENVDPVLLRTPISSKTSAPLDGICIIPCTDRRIPTVTAHPEEAPGSQGMPWEEDRDCGDDSKG